MRHMNGLWIDAMTVAGCVVFALAIVFPSAGLARGHGKAELCMANLHLLMRSWLLYAQDNDTRIVGSATYEWNAWQSQKRPAWSASASRVRVKNFVAFPQDENHNFRNQTVQDEVRGLMQGGLWPYLGIESMYHCPSDTRHLKPPTGISAPNEKGGYRSYSIGNVYNGYGNGDGWATGEYFATVYTIGEILSPSSKIVFLEEQSPQGWNINTWNLFLNDASRWPGDPIVVHNRRSSFGFADGHVGVYAWKDLTNLVVFENQISNTISYPYTPAEGQDLGWFVRHYLPGAIRPELQAMIPQYK
jgi:prepilin-type processing-associated H-X9-DG protein